MSKIKLNDYIEKFNELRAIFDSLPDGIVAILDRNKRIIAANKAVSDLFNVENQKILGQTVSEVIKSPILDEVIDQTINKKLTVRNYTIEYKDQNGAISSFLVSSVLVNEIEKIEAAVVLILHDISEITELRKVVSQFKRYGEIIGDSEPIKKVFSMIDSIRNFDTSVLIIGETGTGKELIARAIHDAGKRKNKPFIPINCSALPLNLIESELFGHVKGAFTGAIKDRPGRFQIADGGTIFLDEVGTLSLELQVKLLRVLQEKVIEPVGSPKSINVDVRIISASNRDLSELVANKEFREDLLYRLKVFQIDLPPLRQRANDIILLTNHFIERLNYYYNKKVIGVSNKVSEIFNKYPWPGNVRQLENAVEHSFILTNGSIIDSSSLPIDLQHFGESGEFILPSLIDLNQEEENIKKVLLSVKGNVGKAAEQLQLHRTTLWRKMKELRIPKGFGKN